MLTTDLEVRLADLEAEVALLKRLLLQLLKLLVLSLDQCLTWLIYPPILLLLEG